MNIKKYQFTIDEIIILQNAIADYKHLIKPDNNASENRIYNYRIACALCDQFRQDLISFK